VGAGRRTLQVSRPAKILFPDDGITKLALAEYYAVVGSVMLPHVRGRPVAMERYPNGLGGHRFYQKNVGGSVPEWITTVPVRKERGELTLVVCNDVATLVYLADQACITPYVWLSRIDRSDHPDQLIFDLDPPEDRFAEARWAALLVRDLLADLRLPSVAKTTGGKGIHVMVPLDRRADFDAVRTFARAVAEVLAAREPKRLTTEQRRGKRNGRLFLDVAQRLCPTRRGALRGPCARRRPRVHATPLERGRGSEAPPGAILDQVGSPARGAGR